MPSLSNLMEDYRNWRGRQEWESGKGWQDFYNGDPVAQERAEKFYGFGTDAGGLVGMIKASHGSPHAFTKFDFSKIGTGEGAQAYGHGGYFAQGFDSPTAKQYQENVKDMASIQAINDRMKELSRIMGADEIAGQYRKYKSDVGRNAADEYDALMEQRNVIRTDPGHLYNVELRWPDAAREAVDPLSEHHLLDWDARLSEQPEAVRSKLLDVMRKRGLPTDESGMPLWASKDPTGEAMYASFNPATAKNNRQAQELASQLMRETGIPGIRYLDQASKGQGAGTRNYVMFDDALANIVSRNGVSLSDLLQNQQQLKSLNPTGSVFAGYNPTARTSLPLGENLTTLSETMGVSPDELITIYRGVPHDVSTINPGDFITTNQQLAKDYAGTGKVISQKVKASDILDDLNESLGEEYIYRPGLKKLLKK